MRSDVMVPRMLTIKEVAALTGIQKWRWYAILRRGEGPPVLHIGKTFRVSEQALVMWIEQQTQRGGTAS